MFLFFIITSIAIIINALLLIKFIFPEISISLLIFFFSIVKTGGEISNAKIKKVLLKSQNKKNAVEAKDKKDSLFEILITVVKESILPYVAPVVPTLPLALPLTLPLALPLTLPLEAEQVYSFQNEKKVPNNLSENLNTVRKSDFFVHDTIISDNIDIENIVVIRPASTLQSNIPLFSSTSLFSPSSFLPSPIPTADTSISIESNATITASVTDERCVATSLPLSLPLSKPLPSSVSSFISHSTDTTLVVSSVNNTAILSDISINIDNNTDADMQADSKVVVAIAAADTSSCMLNVPCVPLYKWQVRTYILPYIRTYILYIHTHICTYIETYVRTIQINL